jgi:spore germination protein YaaH
MTVRRLALLAGNVAAVMLVLPATAPAKVCSKAGGLHFSRHVGKPAGRLSWTTPRQGRFRVYRNGAIVGQTVGRSLRVTVKPGRTYEFTVRAVRSNGRVSKCETMLKKRMKFYPPFTPRNFDVRKVRGARVTLEWTRARRGDGRIGGYRVYRDGRVYRQVKKLFLRARLVAAKTHQFAIAAADTRGNVSPLSKTIRVRSHHRGPTRPRALRVGNVTDTVVGLNWGSSKKGSSRVVGYRIYRDGKSLTQVKGLSGNVGNLAPVTSYKFTVAAVDSAGYVGPAAGPASVRTAMPPPTAGRLHAFLLATTDESFRDLQRHYRQIGTVYPTYFDCYGPGSSLRGANDPLVTQWAQLRAIAVMPRYDCQSSATLHRLLTDPNVRAARIAELVNLVRTQAYDGLNLDFEAGYSEDRDELTSFVATLAQQLHASGKKLSVDVSAKWTNTFTGRSGFYDYAALGAYADTVFVMNWGWHWTTSSPGPPDELANVTKVADYVATMPNKSKFVLGAPLYAQDWPNGGGSSNPSVPKEYGDVLGLIARYGGTPVLDPVSNVWHYTYEDGIGWHDVWYGDASTIGTRIRLAKTRGLGIGFWRLGLEHQGIWDDPLIAPGAVWP